MVAPHRGAWIETPMPVRNTWLTTVAPHRGAWIETQFDVLTDAVHSRVAPHRGAWIETPRTDASLQRLHKSHPTGVRGLKPSP